MYTLDSRTKKDNGDGKPRKKKAQKEGNNMARTEGTIRYYSYKPEAVFHSNTDEQDDLYMGVELEAETPTNDPHHYIEEINKIQNDFTTDAPLYFKPDGSIAQGFETVTHPCTLAYHMKMWSRFLMGMQALGMKSHDARRDNFHECGIHIHVNKNILNRSSKLHLAYFVNSQKANFVKLARRDSQWGAYINTARVNNNDNADSLITGARRMALNWTNSATVEFRCFRGTLRPSTFKATLELVHASVRFAQATSSVTSLLDAEVAWAKFCNYINNEERYENLVAYTIRKGVFKLNAPQRVAREDAPIRTPRRSTRPARRRTGQTVTQTILAYLALHPDASRQSLLRWCTENSINHNTAGRVRNEFRTSRAS